MNNISDGLVIGFDYKTKVLPGSKEMPDTAVLIVGRQMPGKLDIINAFSGEDAVALYEMLTTVKEVNDGQ